jgi:hypothetical protein
VAWSEPGPLEEAPPVVSVVVVISVSIAIVIAMAAVIVVVAVSLVIPVVVVFNAPASPFPVTSVISLAIMVWSNPTSALVWWPRPIAFMPPVMSPHGIPIPLDPHEGRVWTWREDRNHPWRRWRPDHDANGNLRFTCPDRDEKHRKQQ